MEVIRKTVLVCMFFSSVTGSPGLMSNLVHSLIPLLQSASQDIVQPNCYLIVTDGSKFHDYVVQEIIPHLDTPILLETRQHLHETHTAISPGDSSIAIPKTTCKFKIFLIADPNEAIGVVRDILRDKNLQKPVRLAFVSFEPNRKFSQTILESEPLQLFAHAICIRPFRKGGKIRWEIRTHSPLQRQPMIRTLGVWNGTALIKSPETSLFYPAKFLNLHGSELKVCSFLYEPYITEFNESRQVFSGAEISFIQLVGQVLNFTPKFYSPPDGFRWGVPVNNETTWRGLYGELQKGNTDLAIASLYYARGYLPFVEMAYPHYSDCTTILTLKPGQKPRYNALGQPFGMDLWVATFIFFIVTGLLPTVLAEIYYRFLPTNNPGMFFRKPGFALFYNFQAITGIMSTDDRSPWPIRISVSFIWAIFFILICGYRAYLTSSFSLPGTYPSVDTVDQFLARYSNKKDLCWYFQA